MAIRDKLRANAQKHLKQGETIQAVIPAQTTSQWMAALSYWIIILKDSYRVIVVTNQRIFVTKSGRFTQSKVNDIVNEVPRSTKIGPPKGLWHKTDALGGTLYIAKRYFKDVNEADAAATATTSS
ncbi:MAG TPA: PH domain-containing protein [Acidimicrobiales bacterium]|nr:PH domain-containing protein [Acidimicrobiales bacterium]